MPRNFPVTKPVSTVDQDREKDILRAIFIHKELWSKNGYPKKTALQKKWATLLNHQILIDYLNSNEGTVILAQLLFDVFLFYSLQKLSSVEIKS